MNNKRIIKDGVLVDNYVLENLIDNVDNELIFQYMPDKSLARVCEIQDGEIVIITSNQFDLKHFCYNKKRLNKYIKRKKKLVYVYVKENSKNGKLILSKKKPLNKFYGVIIDGVTYDNKNNTKVEYFKILFRVK